MRRVKLQQLMNGREAGLCDLVVMLFSATIAGNPPPLHFNTGFNFQC